MPSVKVHSVIYGNEAGHLRRSVQALARSAELARESGVVDRLVIAFGDCSPQRVLDDDAVASLADEVRSRGVDDIEYTFFDANLGSAAGHNRLLERLDCDYVLIINPDTVASPRLIEELFVPFQTQERVGLVEARQVPFEHPKVYDPRTGETPWATTACALVPRSVVAEVGGFDAASFFLYCDDVDWSWRIRLAGYRIILREAARLFHDKRLDQAGEWAVGGAEEYYSAHAAMFMAHKWGRPDLAKTYHDQLAKHGTAAQRRAAKDFKSRSAAGTLPDPVPGAEQVASFVKERYAEHRF